MFQARAQQRSIPGAVATVGVNERVAFLRRTYGHLAGAILAFVAVSAFLQTSGFALGFARWMMAGSSVNLFIVFGLFIASGFITDRLARSETSAGIQYVGLGLGVAAFAIFLSPMLLVARMYVQDPYIIHKAALFTLLIFGGLTATVFITRKDFSFLRTGLIMASGAALMLIVLSLVFGFNLGLVFSVAMVFLAAGYILYQTSQILAHYDPESHVAASLALFSSLALMFWYMIKIVMRAKD